MLRLLEIIRVLIKYDLARLLPQTARARWLRWLLSSWLTRSMLYPSWWLNRQSRRLAPAQALSWALQELGPVFIKLGQVLSTRRDLLADDFADELACLQDKLAPIESELARSVIERSLGKPIDELFQIFDSQALAAASIAQVHRALLPSGEQVVVKLVRPDIERNIARDLALMYKLAHGLELLLPELSLRLKPSALVREYELTIYAELDMRTEAANCSTLAHNFADSSVLKVPKIYWDLVSREVLVQEYFADKVKVNDLDTLRAHGVNMQKLAENGVSVFFVQVFRDRFFHADMHPGNILVDISDPENPVYAGVDFGIVGTLSENDLHYLGMNMLAFFERDYQAIARLHLQSGWVQGDVDLERFEQAIRATCEPLQALPISEVSFGDLIVNLFAVARRFNLLVQPQLLLFQKTLVNIEGLGRQIYPELDIFTTVWPELKRWRRRRYDPRRLARKITKDINSYWPYINDLPQHLFDYSQQQQRNRLLLEANARAIKHHMRSTRRWRWLSTALVLLLIYLLVSS